MNRELAIRTIYFSTLNGNLSHNSVPIPVTDNIAYQGENDSLYVVFDNQSAKVNFEGSTNIKSWRTTMALIIISKQDFSVSKSILDSVSEQIENLMNIGPDQAYLENGWLLNSIYLESCIYLEVHLSKSQTVISKVLTFSHLSVKQ